MRIADDLQRCVIFLGTSGNEKRGGIECAGTGFLTLFGGRGYLVTARHVADFFDDAPFMIRFNRNDGTAENVLVDVLADDISWTGHPDPDVDLAVMPMNANFPALGIENLYLPETRLLRPDMFEAEDIGVGDMCYTIGLFRLMAGTKRNFPVVHTGNVAALPAGERIPVRDKRGQVRHVEGYLIETQALDGLSGSPVFVRPVAGWTGMTTASGKLLVTHLPKSEPFLLGVWQSSWDAPPDEVMAVQTGREIRVPVGMGIVVPATKLIELFEVAAAKDGHKP